MNNKGAGDAEGRGDEESCAWPGEGIQGPGGVVHVRRHWWSCSDTSTLDVAPGA